jgi:GT2 family glycosyltransferase
MIASVPRSPQVSVVVPCFKSGQTIGRTLRGLFSQETQTNFEVIVVESSQDSTAEWIQLNFPDVRLISSTVRLSAAAARNQGSSHARGNYLAFLDADTAPQPDWLQSLLQRISSSNQIRVVGGAVEIGNPETISARILHWIEFSEFLTGTPSGFKPHLSSSNLLTVKEDFEKAGGFDESFLMAEDLLFSRSFAGGLYFESQTAVTHYYRSSWPDAVRHLWKLGFWSGHLRSSSDTKGSWLRSIPVASLGLPMVRSLLILKRLWRLNYTEAVSAFLHLPFILVALLYWSIGFYQGLRGALNSKLD